MRDIYFRTPFATSGDTTAVPVAVSPSGSISFTQGWGPDYQRDLSSDPLAKPVSRQDMNYLFKQVTAVLSRWQSETVPEWIAPADNGGVAMTYSVGMQVRYRAVDSDPFISYVSVMDANNTVPTNATNWVATSLGVTAPRFNKTKAAATTDFVGDALGSIRKYVPLNANRTITADDIGSAVVALSAGLTATLPTPVSLGIPANSGKCVMFFGLANPLTLIPGAGATVNYDSSSAVASMIVKSGQFVTLMAASDTLWNVISSTAEMKRNEDFKGVLTPTGSWRRLPNGDIEQWGTMQGTTSMAPFTPNLIFPIAFPNACRAINVQCMNELSQAGFTGRTTDKTLTRNGAWIANSNGTSAAADVLTWRAIGD